MSAQTSSAPIVRPWLKVVLGVVVVAGVVLVGYQYWHKGRAYAVRANCLGARQVRNWAETEQLAIEWAALEPLLADPLIIAAQAAMERGNFGAAGDYLDALPDDDPKTVPALLQRVDLMFGQLSRPAEAVRTLERILTLDPGSCEARQRLTFYYAITLQRMKTAEVTRQAIEVGCDMPETYVYLMGSDWLTLANTESVNLRWLGENPGTELFEVAVVRGELANRGLEDSLQDEETAAAGSTSDVAQSRENRLRELFDTYPENIEARAYFIQKAQTAGDVEEVTRLMAAAPPTALEDNRFWRFKAWVQGTRDELEEANTAYLKARELFPYDAIALHEQAVIQRKMGNEEEAARLADLADRGRTLRRTILQQPSVQDTNPETKMEIADYIADCGGTDVASRLRERVKTMLSAATPPGALGPTVP
ncbi:MAG: tetratricopeptide repeat protein [Pirellulales bacterium]